MKKRALGYYDYTVVLTYCGMLSAFSGIIFAINLRFWEAVFCLLISGICDMFDGAVAATKDRTPSEKKFGIQIDSLSDLISFGVLPGLFVYMVCSSSISGEGNSKAFMIFASVASALFALCALIRLAYFNVLEEERQSQTTEKRKSYLGVPVTTVAVVLPLIYMVYDCKLIKNSLCFPILLIILATGFLSPIEIKKPGFIGKIVLVIIGIFEAIGMVLFMGWDLL